MRTLGLPLHVNLCAEATVMVLVYLACSKKGHQELIVRQAASAPVIAFPLPSLRSRRWQTLLSFLIWLPKIESFIKFTVFSSPSYS